jgi:hypothetical protein
VLVFGCVLDAMKELRVGPQLLHRIKGTLPCHDTPTPSAAVKNPGRARLRLVTGRQDEVSGYGSRDPADFQDECVRAYVASWTARGFSPVTIENDSSLLGRTLDLLARPAWEVTVEDVDRLVGDLAADGLSSATRRGYVQVFKGFHRFLQVRQGGPAASEEIVVVGPFCLG